MLPGADRRQLERARAIYVGEAAERWDDLGERLPACVERVIEEVRRLTGPQAAALTAGDSGIRS